MLHFGNTLDGPLFLAPLGASGYNGETIFATAHDSDFHGIAHEDRNRTMTIHHCTRVIAVLCFAFLIADSAEAGSEMKAGIASVVITPSQPIWLSGYSNRDKPAQGKVHDLFAKAAAFESADGKRFVLVTCDLGSVSEADRRRRPGGQEKTRAGAVTDRHQCLAYALCSGGCRGTDRFPRSFCRRRGEACELHRARTEAEAD
jgi:hypothetical protein